MDESTQDLRVEGAGEVLAEPMWKGLLILVSLLVSFGTSEATSETPTADPFGDLSDRIHDYIARATEYVEAHDYALARTYFEPVLISPWITPEQRALAYTTQAFTYAAEGLYVSAALDYVRALEFDEDQTAALAALSYLYAQGLGVARNEEEALRLAKKAAEQGHGYSRVYVATALLDEDIDAARSWLMKAAEDGYTPAYVHLARSFRTEFADEPDPEEATRWYEAAEKEGSVAASLALAYMYRDGEFGEPDGKEAARRFAILAEGGSAHAKAALAHLYLSGNDVDRDVDRAFVLYREASEQGVTDAYIGLGYLYETGTGTDADPAAAEKWYRRGAEEDDPAAQYRLASLLFQPSREDSTATALYWFERAASGGHSGGENNAAWILATSRHDRIRNGTLALHLAQRAVAQEESPGTLDTLAAAYAENGDFTRAIDIQRSAIAALSSETESLREELAGRLAGYEAQEPWRE